jgi:hypothetical protein
MFNSIVVRGPLTADQAKNVTEVFVLAHFGLLQGGVPTRNAALIAAKLGETGWGTAGANAPILNWFSVQPANPGSSLTPQERARIAAFERLPGFLRWDTGKRAVDDTSSAVVRNPVFATTESMVAAQLFIVYGLPIDEWTPEGCPEEAVMFPSIGAALRDETTKYTAMQLGLIIQKAGYGPGYATGFASWYDTVKGVLTRFLSYVRDGGAWLDADVSEEAKKWAGDALSNLPRTS